MKVLVCGSRDWKNREIIQRELSQLEKNTTIVHGACRGADELSSEVGKELGFTIDRHPADWDAYGKAAGPIRNSHMLALSKPDLVIAFHPSDKPSGGTGDMIAKARKAGVEVRIVRE